MLRFFGVFCYFSQALRLLFELAVGFTVQRRGDSEFTGSVLLLAQGLVNPRELVVDRTIVIVGHCDLEMLFRFPVVAELGVCAA
jgi:hypothetical protein